MAVNWLWKHEQGFIYFRSMEGKALKCGFYGANCLGAVIYRYKKVNKDTGKKEGWYDFVTWWDDIEHLKRALGLAKRHDGSKRNVYGNEIIKVKLNVFYPDMLKTAGVFAKAGYKVELYYKEVK